MRRATIAVALALSALASGCGGGGGSSSSTQNTTSGTTGTTTAASSAGPGFIGVTAGTSLIGLPAPALSHEINLMAATGVSSLRQPFYWNVIEPAKGRFTFTSIDPLMRVAARAHLNVLPILLGTPAWAATNKPSFSSPPRNPADYAAFITAVIHRYGPKGTFWRQHPSLPRNPIGAWQIWNEPNHTHYWNKQPFDAAYVRLAKAARIAVKAADPKALVVGPGFAERSWDLIAGMERAGAKGVFDVIAIHPYTFKPANVLRIVRLVRAALVKAGQGSVPIWATEVTWSSGLGKVATPLGFETTEADQAARLTRAFALLAANRTKLGLQRAYWESWLTGDSNRLNTFDYSGLRELHANGTVRAKPAFRAYQRVAKRYAGD